MSSKDIPPNACLVPDHGLTRPESTLPSSIRRVRPKPRSHGFPGPPAPAGSRPAKGLPRGGQGQRAQNVATKYGDTGKEVQLKLVEDTLQAINIKYIAGTSPTTEAAAQASPRAQSLGQNQSIAYYFTPGVYENIKAGRVLAAPPFRRSSGPRVN